MLLCKVRGHYSKILDFFFFSFIHEALKYRSNPAFTAEISQVQGANSVFIKQSRVFPNWQFIGNESQNSHELLQGNTQQKVHYSVTINIKCSNWSMFLLSIEYQYMAVVVNCNERKCGWHFRTQNGAPPPAL